MRRSLTLDQWTAEVMSRWPEAKFVVETGDGETYGSPGDIGAFKGPDMQADMVACFVPYSHFTFFHEDGSDEEGDAE